MSLVPHDRLRKYPTDFHHLVHSRTLDSLVNIKLRAIGAEHYLKEMQTELRGVIQY